MSQKQKKEKAFFHIETANDKLKLYIPQNSEHQQVCLFRQLPLKLLVHLGAQVHSKGTESSAIITTSSSLVIDTILEQDGVCQIPGILRPEIATAGPLSLSTTVVADSVSATSMMRSSIESEMSHHTASIDPLDVSAWGSHTPRRRESVPVDQPELFEKLISFAVHQASHIEALPHTGIYVEASRSAEKRFDHGLAVQSCLRGSVNSRIGAVGELFVSRFLHITQ